MEKEEPDGNNITMVIGIEKLGSLYLSTRGGNGGNGGGGHSGHRSTSGGKGGCGGNSGDIHFTYVANNIIPIFNRSGRSNSIYLDSEGGAGGRGGYGGKTSRRGSYDRKVAPSGSSGCKGKDGKIMLKKL